jgi:hypothetical protein
VKLSDTTCPHCDATVRGADGTVARTAIAVMLGLSTAALGGCSGMAPKYGVPATDAPVTEPSTSAITAPSAPPAGPDPSAMPLSAPEYGVPATN